MDSLRKFVAPEFVFGLGSIDIAALYTEHLGGNKVLLVTDPGIRKASWCKRVENSLKEKEMDYVIFDDILPNPRDTQVMKGAQFYGENGCDILLALGGGSVLDAAKGIGIVVSNGGQIVDYEGIDKIPRPIPPLVCVPTTCGSSADVSQFAIISDTVRKKKIAIVSKALVPDISLIDPETLTTMDKELLVAVSLDTLTHAVEAYVSTAHSFITDRHALGAIELVGQNLIPAIERPGDIDALTCLMQASLEAGLAFSNASLGMVHAMAHVLGGLKDFPHGECNGLLLRNVCRYNYPHCSERYDRIAEVLAMGDNRKPESGIDGISREIDRLVGGSGINKELPRFALTGEECRTLAKMSLQDICSVTNPREPIEEEIAEIYERTFT